MTADLDLKRVRRQIYLYFSEDGLLDLALGLTILGFGLLLALNLPAFVGLQGLLSLLIWYAGKEFLVVPRVGSLKPSTATRTHWTGFLASLGLAGFGLLVIFLLPGRGLEGFLGRHSLALLGLILCLAVTGLGLVIRTSRLYFHGLLLFFAFSAGEFFLGRVQDVDPFLVSVIAAGSLIVLIGLILLGRFLGKYPVVELEL